MEGHVLDYKKEELIFMNTVESSTNPKISVLIPMYNTENYIERCIQSILEQSFSDYEIVVVDDGSKDNSAKIVSNFAEKNHKIKLIKVVNSGVSKARQHALDNANGEYILFVDSDDWIESTMLQEMYEVCRSEDRDGACCGWSKDSGSMNAITLPGEENEASVKAQIMIKKFYERRFLGTLTCYLLKKELFTGFEFPIGLGVGEDFACLYHVLMKADVIGIVNKPLYHYIQYNNSTVHSGITEGKIRAYYYEKDMLKKALCEVEGCEDAIISWYMQDELYLISAMCRSDNYRIEIINEIREDFILNKKNIARNPYLTKSFKISMQIVMCNWHLYTFIYKLIYSHLLGLYNIIIKGIK